jgi:hypothetical protein
MYAKSCGLRFLPPSLVRSGGGILRLAYVVFRLNLDAVTSPTVHLIMPNWAASSSLPGSQHLSVIRNSQSSGTVGEAAQDLMINTGRTPMINSVQTATKVGYGNSPYWSLHSDLELSSHEARRAAG